MFWVLGPHRVCGMQMSLPSPSRCCTLCCGVIRELAAALNAVETSRLSVKRWCRPDPPCDP